MLENYEDKLCVSLADMKCYLQMLDPECSMDYVLCFSEHKFKSLLLKEADRYLELGIARLESVKSFEDMEEQLIMLNELFGHMPALRAEKIALKHLLLALNDPINMYRILRHVMTLDRKELIALLYQKHHITLAEAGYFCLIERFPHEAHHYFMQMNELPSDALLDLYAAQSKRGYLKLEREHRKKHARSQDLVLQYS